MQQSTFLKFSHHLPPSTSHAASEASTFFLDRPSHRHPGGDSLSEPFTVPGALSVSSLATHSMRGGLCRFSLRAFRDFLRGPYTVQAILAGVLFSCED